MMRTISTFCSDKRSDEGLNPGVDADADLLGDDVFTILAELGVKVALHEIQDLL